MTALPQVTNKEGKKRQRKKKSRRLFKQRLKQRPSTRGTLEQVWLKGGGETLDLRGRRGFFSVRRFMVGDRKREREEDEENKKSISQEKFQTMQPNPETQISARLSPNEADAASLPVFFLPTRVPPRHILHRFHRQTLAPLTPLLTTTAAATPHPPHPLPFPERFPKGGWQLCFSKQSIYRRDK